MATNRSSDPLADRLRREQAGQVVPALEVLAVLAGSMIRAVDALSVFSGRMRQS